jgi:hypothetical protein
MFKTILFATALVAVKAWKREVAADDFKTEAYGADNNNYGHQGYSGYGNHGSAYGAHGGAFGAHGANGLGQGSGFAQGINGNSLAGGLGANGFGNAAHDVADAHNSDRTGGHQGQGHNQWTDNAWNQWGTNNHWDAQKSVDNKWGNNSGKINVNLNSVSGHYDGDYGQQKRGLGYEGHQNTSGEVGYQIGLGGHSFGYDEGDHSYGYENKADYGYGGWANNLGAWNHGANYENFGEQRIDTKGQIANPGSDTGDIKTDRRVGYGYGDLHEQDDDRYNQYGNYEVRNSQPKQ